MDRTLTAQLATMPESIEGMNVLLKKNRQKALAERQTREMLIADGFMDPEQAKEMEAAMAKPDQSPSWMKKPVTITYAGERNTNADNPFGIGRQISGKKDKKYIVSEQYMT